MATRFCVKCGLEAVIGDGDPPPCTNCEGTTFKSAEEIEWAGKLRENDKRLLKSFRIAIT